MKYVIRDVVSEQYLKTFDPDVHAPDQPYPTGRAEWTDKTDEALVFANHTDALLLWKTQATVTPLRPDGRPNRPLTAFTVTVERLP